jgi:hypothetical protein
MSLDASSSTKITRGSSNNSINSNTTALSANADLCTICNVEISKESTEVLQCDGCPRYYHLSCVELKKQPQGTISSRDVTNSVLRYLVMS